MDLVTDTTPLKKPSKRRSLSCVIIKNIIKRFMAGETLVSLNKRYGASRKGMLNIFERKTYRDCWTFREMGFLNAEHYKRAYEEQALANLKLSPGRRKKNVKK